uniref:EF-hand domain-containing protein n=1 Tax=Quercus lobata TaxID=97700 RepID=A0A7N2M9E9_QUELO
MKWVTKCLLNSLKVETVLRASLLNYILAGPLSIVGNTLHMISFGTPFPMDDQCCSAHLTCWGYCFPPNLPSPANLLSGDNCRFVLCCPTRRADPWDVIRYSGLAVTLAPSCVRVSENLGCLSIRGRYGCVVGSLVVMHKIFPYEELRVETMQKIVGPITFVHRHVHPFVSMQIRRHRITPSLASIRYVFTCLNIVLTDPKDSKGMGLWLENVTRCGISTDLETCYTARIMALSIIPFIIVQSLKIFSSSSAERIVILIAIVVSTVFLFLYFSYQIFEPWIQKRRLEFVKHKNLILSILQHVQKHALGNILTADGAPNVNAIKRLFEEVDQDGDNIISPSDLRELLLEINFTGTSIDKEKEIGKVMKEFDLDGDQKITMDEFVTGFTKWLDETEHAIDKQYFSKKSLKDVYQVFGPWLLNRRREREMTKDLIQEILRHVQSNVVGGLLKEDGTPDTHSIKRLFEKMEHDSNNCISQHELKELIADIKFGKLPLDVEEAVLKLIEELDTDGDHLINEDEFVSGFAKWLGTTDNQDPSTTESQDDIYQKTWEATDKLVDEKIGNAVVDNSLQAWFKAMMLLVLGIALLAILAEPLIESVQSFSKSASIPSFFISFILVPLATNTRASASAIKEARRKKSRTTSLTFSEIYGGVFMNNILGFSVLLILIYVRELTWEFSAEMLVVLLVCATMGLIASFRSTFPIWTSFLAALIVTSELPSKILCQKPNSAANNMARRAAKNSKRECVKTQAIKDKRVFVDSSRLSISRNNACALHMTGMRKVRTDGDSCVSRVYRSTYHLYFLAKPRNPSASTQAAMRSQAHPIVRIKGPRKFAPFVDATFFLADFVGFPRAIMAISGSTLSVSNHTRTLVPGRVMSCEKSQPSFRKTDCITGRTSTIVSMRGKRICSIF